MSLLNTLALILGIITVATRLPGVVWPKSFREHTMKLIESNLAARIIAVVALALGLIIVAALLKSRPWLEVMLLVLALLWLPTGAVALWRPDIYRRVANKVLLSSDLTLRALCCLGVLVGFLLCFLGIFG